MKIYEFIKYIPIILVVFVLSSNLYGGYPVGGFDSFAIIKWNEIFTSPYSGSHHYYRPLLSIIIKSVVQFGIPLWLFPFLINLVLIYLLYTMSGLYPALMMLTCTGISGGLMPDDLGSLLSVLLLLIIKYKNNIPKWLITFVALSVWGKESGVVLIILCSYYLLKNNQDNNKGYLFIFMASLLAFLVVRYSVTIPNGIGGLTWKSAIVNYSRSVLLPSGITYDCNLRSVSALQRILYIPIWLPVFVISWYKMVVTKNYIFIVIILITSALNIIGMNERAVFILLPIYLITAFRKEKLNEKQATC